MKRIAIVILFAILSVSYVMAVSEPTQQFNKIFLDPFYRASTSANTNYNYTVVVQPPDRISSVKSAIVTFKAYIAPTVTFNLTVNGLSCNNPLYTVSTTYSTTGQGEITFDCSNRIIQSGTYNLVLRPTQANTGAITGWLDLTYMNNPNGGLNVHGTEYVPGDIGKLFLQFLNANNSPVSNSECFLSLWYPNDTMIYNNSLMTKLNNAMDGIYYYNFNVPNVAGVYPASAKCYTPLTFNTTSNLSWAYDGFESNNFTGGTGAWGTCGGQGNCTEGWDYYAAVIQANGTAGGPCYRGLYCAKFTGSSGAGYIERGVVNPDGTLTMNISYAFKFKGFQTNEYAEVFIFDGTWHLLKQIGPLAQYGGYTNDVWYVFNHSLSSTQFELSGGILLGFFGTANTPSGNDEMFVDSVNVSITYPNTAGFDPNSFQYQILRGSGEVHVSNLYANLNATVNPTAIATQVWNYTNRTLTYYPADFTPADMWNYTNRNLTYYPPQQDMTNYTFIDYIVKQALDLYSGVKMTLGS